MYKKEKTRTCIVTRQTLPCDELIRFVIGPDGDVVADLKEKLPGRGVWTCNNKKIVQQACEQNKFAAGFKQKVQVSGELAANIDNLVLLNIQHGLSIAKKSGLAITGFSKVIALARRGDISVFFHASDGKEDGLGKMKSALIAGQLAGGYKKGLPKPFSGLNSAQLDAALGTGNSVHIALIKGGATRSLKKQIMRYDNYCG